MQQLRTVQNIIMWEMVLKKRMLPLYIEAFLVLCSSGRTSNIFLSDLIFFVWSNVPDASLFRVATLSEKLFSGSHLKSRLQFSVRDYYTIIARADWKHMVTGLTLSLLFQSSLRMCGHSYSLRYKPASPVHSKCHPNSAVTTQAGMESSAAWFPSPSQRWKVFFFLLQVYLWLDQEKRIRVAQCHLPCRSHVQL